MAWLHATPKPAPGSRRAKLAQDAPQRSRIDQMKKDGITPRMPPNPMPHIMDRLVEIGMTEAAGMGVVPLSWREINEWQRATGVDLAPWEARLLRRLSAEYIAEGHRAELETCPPPWRIKLTEKERERQRNREMAMLKQVLG